MFGLAVMIISTSFYPGQGLGNQLWVYAVCRSIAARLGAPFKIHDVENFKGSKFLSIKCKTSTLNGQLASSASAVCSAFHERLYYDPDLKYFASGYDERVELIQSSVRIEGLFQDERYFFGQENALREWIDLTPIWREKASTYSDVCVLNIRGGEYKRHRNLILPVEYWRSAMRNIVRSTGVDDFLIVTDDRAYAKALLPGLPVLEGGVADCYAALYGAQCLVVSNSSFSYFPIKTRLDCPFVIAPYRWSRPGNTYERWASPANLYEGWEWQDVDGKIYDYSDCVSVRDKTLAYYQSNYYVNVPFGHSHQKTKINLLPSGLKSSIKYVLSRLFPLHCG